MFTDSESPAVPYCPPQIEVFRFHGYQEAPFDADGFMGYGSPLFTDNAGRFVLTSFQLSVYKSVYI